MIIPNIGLREGCIDQIIGCGVSPLQKEFSGKLVARLQEVDFGIFQRHILHILHELAVVIVPENKITGIPGELFIEPVYDLS